MRYEEICQKLLDGNKRFIEDKSSFPQPNSKQRELLANGQKPFAVVVTCSDSRVVPEFIFDQGLGNLFVIRVAGNVVNKEILGSIEYAVANLGVRFVIVLAHQSCGAVTAAVNWSENGKSEDFRFDCIESAIEKAKTIQGDIVENTAKCNVHLVVDQIKTLEPVIAKLVEDNELDVVGAYYNLKTGAVEIIDSY